MTVPRLHRRAARRLLAGAAFATGLAIVAALLGAPRLSALFTAAAIAAVICLLDFILLEDRP